MHKSKKVVILIVIAIATSGFVAKNAIAQTSASVLYVPLIGITSVPDPLALPKGPGEVTYRYAVKNFLQELALTGVKVVDDNCRSVVFAEGDDNGNSALDYAETWRYTCRATLSTTTQSTATATGQANNLTATHDAYATVVVGSNNPAPLVSIVNITKVAYPLSLPAEGGEITFTYRVNNPGVVPLSNVTVTDNKCGAISGKLGDTNGNGLLDITEVWIYTCTTILKQTTTNTATVTAFANGFQATDNFTLTVKVATPNLPSAGTSPMWGTVLNLKTMIWGILSGILAAMGIFFVVTRKTKTKKKMKKIK